MVELASKEKIEELLNLYKTKGSQALNDYALSYLRRLLITIPIKPQFDNTKAKEEYLFLYHILYSKDKNGISFLQKFKDVSKKYELDRVERMSKNIKYPVVFEAVNKYFKKSFIGSPYDPLNEPTLYFLLDILHDVLSFLNPNNLISMSSKSLSFLIDFYEEMDDYEPHYPYEIYRVENSKLILVDNNFKGEVIETNPNYKEYVLPSRIYFDENQKVILTEDIKKEIEVWRTKGIGLINPSAIS